MSDILLVHDFCHGVWCLDGVIPALAARGHRFRAIDPPGWDGCAVTLDDHAAAIPAALDGPMALVGPLRQGVRDHDCGGASLIAWATRP